MLSHDDILHYEEVLRIVKVGVGHGIRKVRITGGEPLVRKGVCGFLAEINRIEGIEDISLTTNGVLLKEYIDEIKEAGVKRINISLDSLDRDNFLKITGRDNFEKVWEGIHLAVEKGFDPVKINMVVIKGLNDHEILNFAELSIHHPFHIRFIEYMPIGEAHVDKTQQLLTPETKKIVGSLGELVSVESGKNDGPAFRYKFKNGRGELGFISPISRHFCSRCNRLRLTANGMLRSCLLSDDQVDLKTHLRNGCTDEKISELFLESINHKQRKHHLEITEKQAVSTQMNAIGG